MKVAHLNTFDVNGGAARAAYRLHKGLQSLDVTSQMLVQQKAGQDASVSGSQGLAGVVRNKVSTFLDLLPLKILSHGKKDAWGLSWFPSSIDRSVAALGADIIHLHWIGCGFVPLSAFRRLQRPLVWTLHDSWAFTGGCILPGDCLRYRESCGACPQLGSTGDYDLSRWEHTRKSNCWSGLDLTIVAPSRWIGDCARASSLFQDVRTEVIGHGMDLSRFKPVNRSVARQILGLPPDKKLILFGATNIGDNNKGFHNLKLALPAVAHAEMACELVLFGGVEPGDLADIAMKFTCFGSLHDDISLALLYSAADVMCVPSRQESFGQAASEALACGTPVVAFATTGLLDIVDHELNGYLATPFAAEDLAKGINWVLADGERHDALCRSAREKAEKEFALEAVAGKYLSIYEDILGNRQA